MIDWLKIFSHQNQTSLILCGVLAASGSLAQLYSLSGTKYDVIEYCFQPRESKLKTIQTKLLVKGVNKSVKQIESAIIENFPNDELTEATMSATVDFLESTSKATREQRARTRFQARNNSKNFNKFCTEEKKYIAPAGFYDQEKFAPANPRFRREEIYVISTKLTRLRQIHATNRYAKNYAVGSLASLLLATVLMSQRSKRYKREFSAFYTKLETDLSLEIKLAEQERAIAHHSIEVETEYIKDTISDRDTEQRYIEKPPGLIQFEREQAEKQNELFEAQRLFQLAKFKAEIAKLQAEEAKHRSEIQRHTMAIAEPLDLALEIDYKTLCPGTVGELEFYDWRNLKDQAVGIMIVGNSGSAKTSVAIWAMGWLTKDEPAQVLVLDPHVNRNPIWGQLGVHTISDFHAIQRQLEILLSLLDERRGMTYDEVENADTIICFADELSACIKQFPDPSVVNDALERLGCEGRKYKIVFMAGNQSINTKDNKDTSAAMLQNYLIIRLCAIARQLANQWKKEDPRRKHVEKTAYSAVVCGSAGTYVAVHPTHHSYNTFVIKGHKPKGLMSINQSPLTIELATPENTKKNDDWYQIFMDWKEDLGRVPNVEEIKAKWLEVMGAKATNKQAETIHEYLQNLS